MDILIAVAAKLDAITTWWPYIMAALVAFAVGEQIWKWLGDFAADLCVREVRAIAAANAARDAAEDAATAKSVAAAEAKLQAREAAQPSVSIFG